MAFQPDEQWVAAHLARWHDGQEPEALGELLKWQRDRAFAVARRILGSDPEAEDAVQQAFMKLFRSGSTFPDAQGFQAAVYRSVTHSAIDLARNKQARRLVEHAMAQHDQPTPSPGQAVENREAVRILQEEMATLTPEDRALLTLCCQEGQSVVAAAESLELPRETARDRLRRLLTDLRSKMARRGVALSLLLLLGLFQQGRSACASEALCTALDASLPGTACTGIAPATVVGVPTSTLLAQMGFTTGVCATKVWLSVAAAGVLGAAAVTWSLMGGGSAGSTDNPSRNAPVSFPTELPEPDDVLEFIRGDREEAIPLTAVPDAIRDAALSAVPDLKIDRAEREIKKDKIIYELRGRDGGGFVEIEVNGDGEVLRIDRNQEKDEKKPNAIQPPAKPAVVNTDS